MSQEHPFIKNAFEIGKGEQGGHRDPDPFPEIQRGKESFFHCAYLHKYTRVRELLKDCQPRIIAIPCAYYANVAK